MPGCFTHGIVYFVEQRKQNIKLSQVTLSSPKWRRASYVDTNSSLIAVSTLMPVLLLNLTRLCHPLSYGVHIDPVCSRASATVGKFNHVIGIRTALDMVCSCCNHYDYHCCCQRVPSLRS